MNCLLNRRVVKTILGTLAAVSAVSLAAGSAFCGQNPEPKAGKPGSEVLMDYSNFEKGLNDSFGNDWIAEDDSPNKGDSRCSASIAPGPGGKGKALRLDYTLGRAFMYRYALAKTELRVAMDLSKFRSVRFMLRGSGHGVKVMLGIRQVTDYDYHEYIIPASLPDWKEYRIVFRAFKQGGWGRHRAFDPAQVIKVQLQTVSMADGEQGWFEIDDIAFSDAEESTVGTFKEYVVIDKDTSVEGCYLGIFGPFYPEDAGNVKELEKKTGKKFAQVMRFIDWKKPFPADDCEQLLREGYASHITWEPWDSKDRIGVPLDDIISGKEDDYIRKWAEDSKKWGKPYMLRWAHEFNGAWYPWSSLKNGPEKYKKAFRHIRDVFVQAGADKVIWLWCPNTSMPGAPETDITAAYPGDEYVDWVAMDGYNFGHQPGFDFGWVSFEELYAKTYEILTRNYPDKPVMIGEFASGNVGGDKASWIRPITDKLRNKFPKIKSVVWFNINKETDWRIDADPAVADAFHAVASDKYFLTSADGLLKVHKNGGK